MRIRTIKPEFWNHPVLAKMNDRTRLMAIGLLSYADDEGFFFAEPQLIRGSLFPFDEDSTIIRRTLDELSNERILYIKLYTTPQGEIGQVLNFKKHQKIDRPQPSKIRQYIENEQFVDRSTNARRMFDDRSLLEQGTGNREQGTGNKEQGGDFFDFLNSKIFQDVKKYFGLSEVRNPNDLIDLNRFLNVRKTKGSLSEFEKQFPAYCEYKKITKQATHSFRSFIGQVWEDNGNWSLRDWAAELKKLTVEEKKINLTVEEIFEP